MKTNPSEFIDRELSWLDFNSRVLELAENQEIPLFERIKFLAIYASNLDEFFMVRVASLKRRIEFGNYEKLASGFSAPELLVEIQNRVKKMQERVTFLLSNDLYPQLAQHGIKHITWDSLSEEERKPLTQKFINEIFPVLTPLASDPAHPFPHISGLSLNLGIIGRNSLTKEEQFVRVKVPSNLPRVIRVSEIDHSFILLEDLIAENLDLLLPGAKIQDIYFFRVTRNQDLDIDEDDAEDLLETLQEELTKRKFGAAVRIEIEQGVAEPLLNKLVDELDISHKEVFAQYPPLDLTFLWEIYKLDFPKLKDKIFKSVRPEIFEEIDRHDADAFFAAIKKSDVLLHHPYQTFTSTVTRFVELAARDPKVLAIKQTLYRTSGDSPIMHSLIEAARSGKQVLAVIELRARFDEQANVEWAKRLEDAGAHVVYGVLGMKTHAKASLVVRKEPDGLSVYTHLGTGNYNPKTAKIYEDLGLLSADPILGQDLLKLFNHLSGVVSHNEYSRLLVAPNSLRSALVEKIHRERENHLNGKTSRIRWKVNSLVDTEMISELYKAAKDGVPIEIIVRGACSFRLSEIGRSDNVKIRSILGRFLEHSRIYNFYNDGDQEYFIGSADIMERNLNRRIETLVSIKDSSQKSQLDEILTNGMDQKFRGWNMNFDDSWTYVKKAPEGIELLDFQENYLERYKQ